jgi:hypothetical protein
MQLCASLLALLIFPLPPSLLDGSKPPTPHSTRLTKEGRVGAAKGLGFRVLVLEGSMRGVEERDFVLNDMEGRGEGEYYNVESRVEGWGLRVEGWGLRVEGLGLRVEGWGLRVEGLERQEVGEWRDDMRKQSYEC